MYYYQKPMSDHHIHKEKVHHKDNLRVAPEPIVTSVSCTLTSHNIQSIFQSPDGNIFPLSDLIDDFAYVERALQVESSFSNYLEESHKVPFNFLLHDVSITDIQSPDNNGGFTLAGSLALPALKTASFPNDHLSHDGHYRKIFDLDKPIRFLGRQRHAFKHPLKHCAVDRIHHLLEPTSRINPSLTFKDNKQEGRGGVANVLTPSILHGHVINNKVAYPLGTEPTVTEVLNADGRGTDGVKSRYLVSIRDSDYQRTWFMSKEDKENGYIREEGVVVPLEEYAYRTFHFIDNMNETRAANFRTAALWFGVDVLKTVPKITFNLNLTVYPIVPTVDDLNAVPRLNFLRHVKTSMAAVDKPFGRKSD